MTGDGSGAGYVNQQVDTAKSRSRAVTSTGDRSLSDQSVAAPLFAGGSGLILLAIGLTVATNWKHAAERYSNVLELILPSMPRLPFLRPVPDDERWRKLVRQNQIIFAVIACVGTALFVGGLVSAVRHIG